jgi:hypothetical protein
MMGMFTAVNTIAIAWWSDYFREARGPFHLRSFAEREAELILITSWRALGAW